MDCVDYEAIIRNLTKGELSECLGGQNIKTLPLPPAKMKFQRNNIKTGNVYFCDIFAEPLLFHYCDLSMTLYN